MHTVYLSSVDGESPDVEIVPAFHVTEGDCHRTVGLCTPLLLRPVLVTLGLKRIQVSYVA